MNRLAIFVEGEAEQFFVERLVRELAGSKYLHVEQTQARGGRSTKRRTRFVEVGKQGGRVDYYVLIVDCMGDGGVKSRLREEYNHLMTIGYGALIALRDAPNNRADLDRFRSQWPKGVPDNPVQVVFVLAIMEIEAWFMAEHTHFQRIHPDLTTDLMFKHLQFDPSDSDLRQRDHPAKDLDAAYQLVGERYQKGRAAQRTIYSLDIDRMYVSTARQESEMQCLMDAIDGFLSFPS